MQVIAEQDWSWRLYEDGGRLFLTVLCGTIAMYERSLELTPEEAADWHSSGEASLNRLARRVTYSPDAFADRNIADFNQWPGVTGANQQWQDQNRP